MYDTILIPTDGSKHALRAAEHGLYLARKFDASVHLISVADIQAAAEPFDIGGVDQDFIARLETEGENAINAVDAILDETDSIQTAVLRGEPTEAILDYADDCDANILAMGTHGRTGLNRYIAGSVTERVVRLAEAPVLTVRATERSQVAGDYDEILVPTDGSEPAATAVDHGLAIAQQTGARVHAVNIVDVGALSTSPNYSIPTELIEHLKSEGQRATEAIATEAREAGLDAVTTVREGLPARDLLEYADENDIDLITMGTAGRTGLNRHLMGSTTERIIRHAEMPVFAVNARDRPKD